MDRDQARGDRCREPRRSNGSMKRTKGLFRGLTAMLCLAALAGNAAAGSQDAKAAGPDVTTASYGAWIMSCLYGGQSAAGEKRCEIAQTTQLQGRQIMLSRLSIAAGPDENRLLLVAEVPEGVWLPADLRLEFPAGSGVEPIAFRYLYCSQGACLAEAELDEETLSAMGRQQENGNLVFARGENQPAGLPVSFQGLSAAYQAMMAETGRGE